MKLSIKITILCFLVTPLLQAANPRSRLAQYAIPVAGLVGVVAIGAAGFYHPQLCLGALGTASHYAGRAAAPVAQYAGIAFEVVRPVATNIFWAGARQVTVTNVLKVGGGFLFGKFYYMRQIKNAETNVKTANAECENQRSRANQLQNQVERYRPFYQDLDRLIISARDHALTIPQDRTFRAQVAFTFQGTMQQAPTSSRNSVSLSAHSVFEEPMQRQEARSWLDIVARVLHHH